MPTALASSIPDPRLRAVENLTPFALFQCDKMGPGRRFHDTVVVKGTFTWEGGKLRRAERQAPVVLADHPWDLEAPERSSVRLAGEAVLVKPRTDVLVTGSVRALGGRPRAGWDVAVVVQGREGRVLEHHVQVTGPRWWRYGALRGFSLSDPEPAAEVPIRYELAYGGAYPDRRRPTGADGEPAWVVHWPNPSGTGFFDEAALSPTLPHPAPQWQPPGRPVKAMNQEVPLAGLGPLGRPWSARRQWAGTYDDAWLDQARDDMARGLPADYPADFDPRFFQCAHPGLVSERYLRGDEAVALFGASAEHEWLVAQLPGLALQARLLDGQDRWHEAWMPLDTVHVDLDAAAVHLCWRLTLDQARDVRVAVISALEAR